MKSQRDYSAMIDGLRDQCPVRAALDVVGGRWKPSILWELKGGTRRYSDLRGAMAGISAQALTLQLRQLEADGIVLRTVYPEIPARVEYCLPTCPWFLQSRSWPSRRRAPANSNPAARWNP